MNFSQILKKITDYDKTPIVLIDYSGSTYCGMNFYSDNKIDSINFNSKIESESEDEEIKPKPKSKKDKKPIVLKESIIINKYENEDINKIFDEFKNICEKKFEEAKLRINDKNINRNRKVFINKVEEDTKLSQINP